MNSITNGQLRVALINGVFLLVGTIAGGVISNWSGIFGTTVTATYTGYKPTGAIDTEARYFMEVSGTRRDFEIIFKQKIREFEGVVKTISETLDPEESDQLSRILLLVQEEGITAQEMIDSILPVYQEYYTVKEMQELNKFFSTEIMQAMTAKSPVVWEKLFLAIQGLEKTAIKRYSRRLLAEFADSREIQDVATKLLEAVSDSE